MYWWLQRSCHAVQVPLSDTPDPLTPKPLKIHCRSASPRFPSHPNPSKINTTRIGGFYHLLINGLVSFEINLLLNGWGVFQNLIDCASRETIFRLDTKFSGKQLITILLLIKITISPSQTCSYPSYEISPINSQSDQHSIPLTRDSWSVVQLYVASRGFFFVSWQTWSCKTQLCRLFSLRSSSIPILLQNKILHTLK